MWDSTQKSEETNSEKLILKKKHNELCLLARNELKKLDQIKCHLKKKSAYWQESNSYSSFVAKSDI